MVDIQSLTGDRDNRQGKERRKKPQLQNIMACSLLWAAIKIKGKKNKKVVITGNRYTDRKWWMHKVNEVCFLYSSVL